MKTTQTRKPALTLLAIDFRNPTLRARAAAWRERVETALAIRLGGGSKGRSCAMVLLTISLNPTVTPSRSAWS